MLRLEGSVRVDVRWYVCSVVMGMCARWEWKVDEIECC